MSSLGNTYAVFADFIEMSAIALSSKFDKSQFDKREKRYLEIVGKYSNEEANRFAQMFTELVMCYRDKVGENGEPGLGRYAMQGLGDVLGEIYMALDLGSDRAGQFFTPYSVSFMMAKMTIGDGKGIREQGFIEMHEPACGSGGMVVATADAMHQAGLNYPYHMHATCIDVDPRCMHMAYLQLALLGIGAIVIHGNSLTMQQWDVWYTRAHFICGWPQRLAQRKMEKLFKALLTERAKPVTDTPQPTPEQASIRNAA
ncbi:N-6 DNA methylase [Paraburkholderia sp. JHI869]|uniref:N-6 DNA methylase n=1 Tax=Paraburkholderia sp. JHI869 TaxID=3112959 RepID=UPI0031765696